MWYISGLEFTRIAIDSQINDKILALFNKQSNSAPPRSSRYQETSLAAFSRPNLLRSLVWIAPTLEKILSIAAELDGRWSSIMARSHRPEFTPLHVFLIQVHHTPGFSFPTQLSRNNDLRNGSASAWKLQRWAMRSGSFAMSNSWATWTCWGVRSWPLCK